MKLHITPEELDNRFRETRVSPKRLAKLIDEKAKCPIFFLSAHIPQGQNTAVAILVTEIIGAADGKTRMSFEPVSAKSFTVFDAKTKELQQATLMMPHGQYTFTKQDCRKTEFSLEGPGVDPNVVQKSWNALFQIFSDETNRSICTRIVKHIKESLTTTAAAA